MKSPRVGGSGSRLDPPADRPESATENLRDSFTVIPQKTLFDRPESIPAGSLDDSKLVRETLVRSIRKCRKSRAQIAEDITRLTGRKVTEISLNKFTAETRSDYRWPAELDRAFAASTGDDSILRCRAEAAGYHMVTDAEYDLLRLGVEYLRQKRAGEQVARLEKRLEGADL